MSWSAVRAKCGVCGKDSLVFADSVPPFRCGYCDSPIAAPRMVNGTGYVYVLSNPCMPGLLKIGFTERNVEARAKELSSATGVPAGYDVEAVFPATDAAAAEAAIH